MIALLCLLLALLALLLRRSPPPPLPFPTPDDDPSSRPLPDPCGSLSPHSPPLPTRHVSFSPLGSDTSYSLPVSSSPPRPILRRWSSPFHKRTHSPSASPCAPQSYTPPPSVDAFGRLPPSSSSPSFHVHTSPKSARRLSTPLRLSLTSKRRSSSVSYTSTSIPLDRVDAHAPSPASHSSPPPQRTRFVNPFRKRSRSRTPSPPSNNFVVYPCFFVNPLKGTFNSPDASSNLSSTSSSSSPPLGESFHMFFLVHCIMTNTRRSSVTSQQV